MAVSITSPFEHPGRNLQKAVCLCAVQSAAEKHAIGLLDDRVNPDLVRKPGMIRIQNLTPDGPVGVLKPCCTTKSGRTKRLASVHLPASISLRPVRCQGGFPSPIIHPKPRFARSGPTARSNGVVTSSIFAALWLAKRSLSRKPRTDPGRCASSACPSASSTSQHAGCGAALAQRRSRSNHERLSPIHPVYCVTYPSAGQRSAG